MQLKMTSQDPMTNLHAHELMGYVDCSVAAIAGATILIPCQVSTTHLKIGHLHVLIFKSIAVT